MTHVPPLIQDNTLLYQQDGQNHVLLVNTPGWFTWLTTASSFRFISKYGSFTARKEQARQKNGGWYWKAYRKQKNKLFSHYLGKSESLSLEHLMMAAGVLARKGEGATTDEQQVASADSNAHDTYFSPEHVTDFAYPAGANVPVPLTPLIGRERQLQIVCSLLQRPAVRLVTLTGTGGVGKTRLALQVAREVRHLFPDGVFFVPLAALKDPGLVIPAIAQSLGLWEATDHSLQERLSAYLHKLHVLLLLDNFEQVMAAAPQLADLLAYCPSLHLLVTSRAVLHIQGEYEFVVDPLAVPDLEQMQQSEDLTQVAAVTLFVERAQAIKPGFQLTATNARTIAEICVRLDGLPLALELAAARVKHLPPQTLLKRLSHRLDVLTGGARDLPVRQQTLRNTLQWSYDLLTVEEQRLFRLLSVFVGGCNMEAITAVARIVDGAGGTKAMDVFEGVMSLLDKSLLCQTEYESEDPRLSFLKTIREYGLTCLQEQGELEAVRQAHATYYLQLVEKAADFLFTRDAVLWLERLEREHENLRAALTWALEREGEQKGSGIEVAVRFANVLWRFWTTRGYLTEGSTFLEQILAASVESEAPVRAQALCNAIVLAWHQEDYARLKSLCNEQFPLCQRLGDREKIASCLFAMAGIALYEHNYMQALALAEDAVTLFRATGMSYSAATCLMFLGRIISAIGDYAVAEAVFNESLTLYRTLGYQGDIAWPLIYLARNAIAQRDYVHAHALLEEALSLCREVGYKWGLAHALGFLGLVTLEEHNFTDAHTLLTESLRLNQEVGNRRSVAWSAFLLASALALQHNTTAAYALYEQSLATAIILEHRGLITSCLKGMAEVMSMSNRSGCAAQLWATAEAVRQGKITSLSQVLSIYTGQTGNTTHILSHAEALVPAFAEESIGTAKLASAVHTSMTTLTMPRAGRSTASSALRVRQASTGRLTTRELEVLSLVAQGLTDAQVAARLAISYRTVTTHLTSIFNKLGVNSRTAAVRLAFELHLT